MEHYKYKHRTVNVFEIEGGLEQFFQECWHKDLEIVSVTPIQFNPSLPLAKRVTEVLIIYKEPW